jgi:septal ring factor EnvC (AmiA/AmiB activator)
MAERLTLTRVFEGAGLNSGDAERIATEIYEAVHNNVATKCDLRTEIGAVRGDLKTEIAAVRAEIAAVRADLRELEQRLGRQIDRMVVRLGARAVIVAGLLFAALQRWPPH